jgi:large subunit ribosomal protein L25
MEMTKIRGSAREVHGKRRARRLRRDGQIPGVIYGHKQAPQHITLDLDTLKDLLEHGSHVIELDVDGDKSPVLIRDVQLDPLGQAPLHVDFLRVDLNERVEVAVPLEFRGTPAGLNEGGLFEEHLVDLEVEALATQIPESVRVNIAHLNVGDSLHVSELELPSGVSAVTSGDTLVCTVRAKAAAPEEEEAEEALAEGAEEPEIIRPGKKEEEDQEAS